MGNGVRGKTARTRYHTARHLADTRRKNYGAAEERALWKLVLCGIIFVLLVAVKLLFPETAGSVAQSVSQMIGGNADFKEAFAAMGRAVSGEETVGESLQDAYTAVFHSSLLTVNLPRDTTVDDASNEPLVSDETSDTAVSGEEVSSQEGTAEEIVPSSEYEEGVEAIAEDTSDTTVTPTLPENASMEQRVLGFSYATPLHGTMSSSFGWREHPIDGGSRFHYGLDLAAESGTDICAFADGEVFATGESSTLGQYIILSHAQGYRTLYAHCSEIVKLSGHVALGEVIAKVGQSGAATGPHLHFELQDGTLYLNPIYYVDLG